MVHHGEIDPGGRTKIPVGLGRACLESYPRVQRLIYLSASVLGLWTDPAERLAQRPDDLRGRFTPDAYDVADGHSGGDDRC